jgi:predicted transcriptional regulator
MSDQGATIQLQGRQEAKPTSLGRADVMSDKMTKRDMFLQVLVILAATGADTALSEGIQHEINLLDKKRANKGANAAKVAEQNEVKGDIVHALEASEVPMRATEIGEAIGVTVQKASALLRQMVADEIVGRVTEKKVTTFFLVTDEGAMFE